MSGVNYHAWTHRPKELGGTDPLPGSNHEYAYFLKYTNATLNSGAAPTTMFVHDENFTSDDTCIQCNTDATWGGTFEILKTGIYLCSFGGQFTTTFTASKRAAIQWDVGLFATPTNLPARSEYESPVSDSEITTCGMAIVRFIAVGTPPGVNTVTCYLQQTSGSAKTIDNAGALLVRIQAFD